MKLVGLAGVKGGVLEGNDVTFVRSVTGAMKALRTKRAVTLANDRGAITVWKDDDLRWRGSFCQHLVEKSAINAEHKSDLIAWLWLWLPKTR